MSTLNATFLRKSCSNEVFVLRKGAWSTGDWCPTSHGLLTHWPAPYPGRTKTSSRALRVYNLALCNNIGDKTSKNHLSKMQGRLKVSQRYWRNIDLRPTPFSPHTVNLIPHECPLQCKVIVKIEYLVSFVKCRPQNTLFLLPNFPPKICHARWPATSPSGVSRPCLKVHACPSYSLYKGPRRLDDEHITDFYYPWQMCTQATNTDNPILHNVQVGFTLTFWGEALGSWKIWVRHDTTVFYYRDLLAFSSWFLH
jgi:hypothetical protein